MVLFELLILFSGIIKKLITIRYAVAFNVVIMLFNVVVVVVVGDIETSAPLKLFVSFFSTFAI